MNKKKTEGEPASCQVTIPAHINDLMGRYAVAYAQIHKINRVWVTGSKADTNKSNLAVKMMEMVKDIFEAEVSKMEDSKMEDSINNKNQAFILILTTA